MLTPGAHDRRADQRQHRHRPGHGRRRQGLPADAHHAGEHERRTPGAARGLRRRTGPDPRGRGHDRARSAARPELADEQRALHAPQFDNPANPEAHRRTTALEIWDDTERRHRRARRRRRHRRHHHRRRPGAQGEATRRCAVVAVEPAESPVLSGGAAGPHGIQGIGAGFVPEVLDTGRLRRGRPRSTSSRPGPPPGGWPGPRGILAGVSSGAALHAAARSPPVRSTPARPSW